jgi:hypothetical protein
MKNQIQILAVSISLVLMVGCNPNLNSKTPGDQLAAQNQNIDELPTVFENPDIDIESVTQAEPTVTAPNPATPAAPPAQHPTVTEQKPTTTPEAKPDVKPQVKPDTKPVVTQPKPNVEQKPTSTQASRFIQYAHEVMIKEGKSLGTPCNYYVQRVLVRAGFPKGDFRANDFDLYAKKNFSFYKAEDFKIDTTRSDKDELKKHLWSYPERTPFILQWTRPGHYGHIAILERIGDSLIIYQASIGGHTAERSQTKIETLLSSRHRAYLTVYSEFK